MRILLVDDHRMFRVGLALQIGVMRPEVRVDHCESPEQAREMLRNPQPPYDVLVIDLGMPGFKDLEALRYFRRLFEETPCVVVSGQELPPDQVRQCVDMGAFGFIPKTLGAEDVAVAIDRMMTGDVWLPPSALSVEAGNEDASSPSVWSRANLRLTARQGDVLRGLVAGKPNKVIARDLGISDGTVKTHVVAIFDALGIRKRTKIMMGLAAHGIRIQELVDVSLKD